MTLTLVGGQQRDSGLRAAEGVNPALLTVVLENTAPCANAFCVKPRTENGRERTTTLLSIPYVAVMSVITVCNYNVEPDGLNANKIRIYADLCLL